MSLSFVGVCVFRF